MVEVSTSDVVVFQDWHSYTINRIYFSFSEVDVTKQEILRFIGIPLRFYMVIEDESLIKQVQQLLWLNSYDFWIQMSRLAVAGTVSLKTAGGTVALSKYCCSGQLGYYSQSNTDTCNNLYNN
jgi:hypothetical protein